MLALVTPLLWSPSSVLYTELAPQQSTTTARTSCSTVLQSSEGPARSTAELAVVAVVVGTKAPLSAIHRRSFPSLKAGYTVDAHIEALVDERDVASSFVPGHCSRRKAPRALGSFAPSSQHPWAWRLSRFFSRYSRRGGIRLYGVHITRLWLFCLREV